MTSVLSVEHVCEVQMTFVRLGWGPIPQIFHGFANIPKLQEEVKKIQALLVPSGPGKGNSASDALSQP